jgi:hypothetical protein
MQYYDYDLDLSKERIVLDREITLQKLEWNKGDYFEVREENGHNMNRYHFEKCKRK